MELPKPCMDVGKMLERGLGYIYINNNIYICVYIDTSEGSKRYFLNEFFFELRSALR